MRLIPVAYVIGWLLVILAISMVVPIVVAASLAERTPALAFALSAVATLFVGGSLILALKSRAKVELRRHGLMLLGVAWLLLPMCAAAPLWLSGALSAPIPAYFEAVSALTTTGATVFRELGEVPKALIIWRALLQWIGGLGTILGIAIIIAPTASDEPAGLGYIQSGHAARAQGWLPRATFGTIIPLYLALTGLCLIGLLIAGIPSFDATSLAFSAVSTGGFMPRDGTIELYGAPAAELVLSLTMFAGAISLLWLRALLTLNWSHVFENREPFWIALAIAILAGFIVNELLASAPGRELATTLRSLALAVTTAASFVTTTGFAVSERATEPISYVVLLTLCFIGAGRFSTAGGLKFQRVGAMIRHCGRELHHLIYPHSVLSGGGDEERSLRDRIGAIWANFAVAVVVATALTLYLAATGLTLPAALLAAVSAIGNIGPAYELAAAPELALSPSYAALEPGAQLALTLGMVFGRFEVLALLAFLNLSYWRS